MKKLNCLLVAAIIISSFHAQGDDAPQAIDNQFNSNPQPTNQLCFQALNPEDQAKQFFWNVVGKPATNSTADFALAQLFQTPGQLTTFYISLARMLKKINCVLDNQPTFKIDTYNETIDALVHHAYTIKPEKLGIGIEPGNFLAVIAGYAHQTEDGNSSQNKIVIEVTDEGLKFHACERNINDPPNATPLPPTVDCPYLFEKSVYIPVDTFLKFATGFKTAFTDFLKAVANIGVVFTSNLGLALLSPVAATASAFTNPEPLPVLLDEQRINWAMKDEVKLIQLEDQSFATQGIDRSRRTYLVTRVFLDVTYDSLKQGLIETEKKIGIQEMKTLDKIYKDPNNPNLLNSPAETIERDFRQEVQQEISGANAANAASATPTSDAQAAAPTAPPVPVTQPQQ